MLKKILRGFSIIAIILTIAPLFTFDTWFIRMFDFPHVQLSALTLLAFLLYYIKFDYKSTSDWTYIALMFTCLSFQIYKVRTFFPFYPEEIKTISTYKKTHTISLLTSNVLQSNKNKKELLNVISDLDPDVLLFTEVNRDWTTHIKNNITKDYKYSISFPLKNTYGILMCSKKPLIEAEVNFLVDDSIPSINTKIKLDNGKLVQFYGLHPTPPMPQHNPKSTQRDTEFMFIAQDASKSNLPVLVMGDFNDVPWSSTMQLFKVNSLLLDPRIGRGFYNTYNSESSFLRWPLDHAYVSKDFRLIDLKVCKSIDSDHFPYYIELAYSPENSDEQKPTPPTKQQKESAKAQIEKFHKMKRD